MHLRRSFAAVPIAAALIACFASAAAAAPLASYDHPPVSGPWSLAPGEYYVDLTGTTFQTTDAYDADGHLGPLGGTIEQRTFRSYVELGWKKRLSVQFSLPYATQTERPTGGTALSATGLEDFRLGFRYVLASGPSATALQFSWETPAGYNRRLEPSLGDGLQKLSATLQTGGPATRRAFWQLGGGFRFQYKALGDIGGDVAGDSSHWKWPEHMVGNGAAGLQFGHLLAAGLFATDVSSFLPGAKSSRVTSVALGTRFTYRTDERVDVFAGSWHTPSGRNALALSEFYAGVAWRSTKLTRLQGFLGGEARP